MNDAFNFTDENTAPDRNFEVMPVGDYNMSVIATEWCANSAGTGHYAKFTLKILDGKYANRQVIDQLNLDNPNEVAVGIARRSLGEYARAMGIDLKNQVKSPSDFELFKGKPIVARLKVEVDKNGVYDDKNAIARVKGPATGVQAAPPAEQPQQGTQAPTGNNGAGGQRPTWA